MSWPSPRPGLVIRYSYLWQSEAPLDPDDAVELPQATKVRLGLDSDRSWIVVSEGNRFVWPGPDLRPQPGRDPATSAYGMLPRAVFDAVRARFLARVRARRAGVVKRTQ